MLEGEGDCAERGYLVYCEAEEALGGDVDKVIALVEEVRGIGRRFGDPCLVALLRSSRAAPGSSELRFA